MSSNPIILSVKQKSATSVIVEWSQPSGGATVTAYVVHYSDGVDKMTEDVPAPSTSSSITNLTNCLEYTFIVEAMSEHLSGESDVHTIALGIKHVHPRIFIYLYSCFALFRCLGTCSGH